MDLLLGRGWLWIGVGIGIAVVGTGCTLGIHSTQGRNSSSNLTLTPDITGGPLTGTVDESTRSTELVLGGMNQGGGLSVLELGASFGTRNAGFESATDGLMMVPE